MNWKLCVLVLVTVVFGCEMGRSDCASCDAVQADNSCFVPDVLAKDIKCQVKNCDDGNPCTKDAFNSATCECDSKSDPDCKLCKPFAGSSECDDGNPCTDDECVLVVPTDNVGMCEHILIEGCTP